MTGPLAVVCALALVAPPAGAPAPAPGPEPAPARVEGPARSMVLAGTVLAMASIAAYVVMTTGVVLGRQADDRLPGLSGPDDIDERRKQLRLGRTGNILAITGGAAAAALMVTGITLIAVGRRRGRAPGLSFVPLRRGGGLGWSTRF